MTYNKQTRETVALLQQLSKELENASRGKLSTNDITPDRLLWEIINKIFSILVTCENGLHLKAEYQVWLLHPAWLLSSLPWILSFRQETTLFPLPIYTVVHLINSRTANENGLTNHSLRCLSPFPTKQGLPVTKDTTEICLTLLIQLWTHFF